MTDKPKTATRASSRTKAAPAPATTTRSTRAKAPVALTTAPKPSTTKKAQSSKNKENPLAEEHVEKAPVKKTVARKTTKKPTADVEMEREPIMAFLRIRPKVGEDEDDVDSSPYLTQMSNTAVRMVDPHDLPGNSRRSLLPPSSTYTFSRVFEPNTSQSDFFEKTTLPLVKDALEGQNALLFAYGVTNSGKTYTIQGESQSGSAGILPRTLDVVFNSIQGLHGDGRYRPVRLQGVELSDPSDAEAPEIRPEPVLEAVLGEVDSDSLEDDLDSTAIKLDRNYEYTIWLSYAEVYNEKVYDLLESVQNTSNPNTAAPRSGNPNLLLTRQALTLKPSPPSDGLDSGIRGKYISGLKQFRVHSAAQAKALVKLGQMHRRVFGTLANRESSRSHGMVLLKIVRGHRGERNDPTALQISRLTLVDLAGSERTKHTHTTGDRLREAGSINKSLMVLGQCLEILRSNQRKLAISLAHDGIGADGRMDTRDVKKGLAIVPFRHSKLTEVLMDYFVGDGRVVMIVNVNPYDTGYDENSHVMKFAALAREVYVTPAPATFQHVPSPEKNQAPATPSRLPKPTTRKVTISIPSGGAGRRPTDAVLEVIEVDEADESGDFEDDEPINPLVDALFDEVEELRMQLFESEMRCAMIETETREEVTQEMEARMKRMQERFAQRLRQEMEQSEAKTDAKIDLLYQSGMFGSPVKKARRLDSSDEDAS